MTIFSVSPPKHSSQRPYPTAAKFITPIKYVRFLSYDSNKTGQSSQEFSLDWQSSNSATGDNISRAPSKVNGGTTQLVDTETSYSPNSLKLRESCVNLDENARKRLIPAPTLSGVRVRVRMITSYNYKFRIIY